MKFYHLSDIHLGAEPDRDCTYGKKRSLEIWETFRRVLEQAKDEKPDCIFISGDLFHRQPLKRELNEVKYLFEQIPDIHVFLAAGNHDYCNNKSAYLNFSWSANVHFIKTREISKVRVEELDLTVYGHSYWEREIRQPIYDELNPVSEDGIHILLAHGGDAAHIPMNYRKIGQKGFTYVAMGHIHKPGIHKAFDMAYAGALEPLDVNETGNHGYIKGDISPDHTGKYHTELTFIPAAGRSYVHLNLEITEQMGAFELEDLIKASMRELGEHNMFRLIFSGVRDIHWRPETERLMKLGNVTDIMDRTRVSYDLKELKEQYRGHLAGAFLESFDLEMLQEQQEALDRQASKEALVCRLGLEALLETAGGLS